MTTTTIKTDPIRNDKMKFHTQIVDGKPRIFFDVNDGSSTITRSKRNSRPTNNTSRFTEQQKSKINNKSPTQNGTNKQTTKAEQPTDKTQVNDDGSTLGVYMTMDELTELVKAVKESNKNEKKIDSETKVEPLSPPLQQQNEPIPPLVPKLELPADPPPPPPVRVSPRDQVLSVMAEKKRQKWNREKAEIERLQLEIEYDQLKHQLSPRYKKNSVSPERSTFQYDFPPSANKSSVAPSLPQSSKQNDCQQDVSLKVNEDPNSDISQNRLLERKQQQWKQENSESMQIWNPFGRPGGGAPNINENQPRTSQQPSNNVVSYRPPIPQKQNVDNSASSPPSLTQSNQTHIPAAMRRNLLFGDVRFEDDVRAAKEIDRRQWLDALQKQVEENQNRKYTHVEPERRQDFLRDNIQPLVQEAASRHQQQKETSTTNNTKQDLNRFDQHDSSMQQTRSEGDKSTKHDKRAQLIDKLKRNGYQMDLLTEIAPDVQSTGPVSNQKTGEKIFGSSYNSSGTQNVNRVERLHLNMPIDPQYAYRPSDARRDEAVNTVDSTFRSDHSSQTDFRVAPHRQTMPYSHERLDLPPQVPNHHFHNAGYRNIPNQPGKKYIRLRSFDDDNLSRRTPTMNHSNSNDDGSVSQMSGQRGHRGPVDIRHRPLWNYNNPEHREYIPNSKRDPHYERRQRLKHFEQGNFDRIDDVQKKTCYNRWNSDSELQQSKRRIPANRVHSTLSKVSTHGAHKDETIMNLLKVHNKHQKHETFGTRKSSSYHTKADDDVYSNRESSLDKYESVPYTRTDEIFDRTKDDSPTSQSRDISPHKQLIETKTSDNYQQQEWNNTNREYSVVHPTQNNQPISRQEHILQQLSAIKENLVRRQRELASSMDPVPV